MNLELALNLIKLNCPGSRIEKKGNSYFINYGGSYPDEPISIREIIKWGRCYTSDCRKTGVRFVKRFNGGKDRSATRDAIKTENFDILHDKKQTKKEDLWNWD